MDHLTFGTSLFAAAEGGHAEPGFLGLAVYLGIVLVIIFSLMASAKKAFGKEVIFKNVWAQRFEQLYLFIENMCVGIIGPHGRRYIPMIMTFWLLIFISSFVALFMPYAPTADLSWNLGMALVSIAYVQWEGMKANGPLGHFAHFSGPKLAIGLIPITLMIFMIEIVSEVMKNVSLSLRLYGNIHGGHQAVEAMNNILPVNIGGHEIGIPFGFLLIPIKLLTCLVQALIFSLLTCVYINLVTAHGEGHGDDHGHGAQAHAH